MPCWSEQGKFGFAQETNWILIVGVHVRNGHGGSQAPTAVATPASSAPPVVVSLDCIRDTETSLDSIKAAVARYPGNRPLHLCLRHANGQEVLLAAGTAYQVSDAIMEADEIQPWLAN